MVAGFRLNTSALSFDPDANSAFSKEREREQEIYTLDSIQTSSTDR